MSLHSGLIGGAIDVLTRLLGQDLVTIALFLGSLYLVYKGVKLGIKLVTVGIAGAAFPLVASSLLGLNIPFTFETAKFYATAALVLFVLWEAVKKLRAIIGFV